MIRGEKMQKKTPPTKYEQMEQKSTKFATENSCLLLQMSETENELNINLSKKMSDKKR